MHVRLYVCMHACMHACIYIYMYVCMYVCMYVYVYVYMYIYIYICICVCVSGRLAQFPTSAAIMTHVPTSLRGHCKSSRVPCPFWRKAARQPYPSRTPGSSLALLPLGQQLLGSLPTSEQKGPKLCKKEGLLRRWRQARSTSNSLGFRRRTSSRPGRSSS